DVHPLGLVVQLVLRASGGAAGSRALPAAAAGRHVGAGELGRRSGLAAPRPLLVDRPGCDLLGPLGGGAALLRAVLDVLVLPFSLVAPCSLRHGSPPGRRVRFSRHRGARVVTFQSRMPRALVIAARQPEFTRLLEEEGFEVEVHTRPLDANVGKADVAVVFRGRLIGRGQAAQLARANIPVVEVLTSPPTSPSTRSWVKLSNRIAKPDLVQVVHALAERPR